MSEGIDERTQSDVTEELSDEELSDEELAALKRRRFEARVQRVIEVMRRERIDWRGVPYIGPDGRIRARVAPVEVEEQ